MEDYEALIAPIKNRHKLELKRLEGHIEYLKLRVKWSEYEADNPEDYFLNELDGKKNIN